MTLNEKIALKMGWDTQNNFIRIYFEGKPFDPTKHIEHAKLLQQKMVDDEWIVCINAMPKKEMIINKWPGVIECYATRPDAESYEYLVYANTEPAAIVALFCKVYGLEV